jgi:hypothetical protein
MNIASKAVSTEKNTNIAMPMGAQKGTSLRANAGSTHQHIGTQPSIRLSVISAVPNMLYLLVKCQKFLRLRMWTLRPAMKRLTDVIIQSPADESRIVQCIPRNKRIIISKCPGRLESCGVGLQKCFACFPGLGPRLHLLYAASQISRRKLRFLCMSLPCSFVGLCFILFSRGRRSTVTGGPEQSRTARLAQKAQDWHTSAPRMSRTCASHASQEPGPSSPPGPNALHPRTQWSRSCSPGTSDIVVRECGNSFARRSGEASAETSTTDFDSIASKMSEPVAPKLLPR